MPSLIAVGGGAVIQGAGAETARATTLEGAKTQADIERQSREAQTRQFEKQIERQQPLLDVGNLALPQFIEALSNRGDASGLPATQIQSDLISQFLGDQAPEFVKERALGDLGAVEAERNKGRLADLVSSALGGAMTSAGQRVDLGSTVGRSIAQEGNILGQGLQQSAIQRANTQNQAVQGLAGLPAYYAAQKNNVPSAGATMGTAGGDWTDQYWG